jgi:hypothetical protein
VRKLKARCNNEHEILLDLDDTHKLWPSKRMCVSSLRPEEKQNCPDGGIYFAKEDKCVLRSEMPVDFECETSKGRFPMKSWKPFFGPKACGALPNKPLKKFWGEVIGEIDNIKDRWPEQNQN